MADDYVARTKRIVRVDGYDKAQKTASALIKTGKGTLHGVTFSQADAVPTAGTIALYDALTATGTAFFTHTQTTAVFMPATIVLDVEFTTGLYLAITTTDDVNVLISYK